MHTTTVAIPGHTIPNASAPGHWLLARLGKRVLRPGGVELTRRMLDALSITPADRVVELAPGMGHTAERVIALKPASYIGVDRDEIAIARLRDRFPVDAARFVQGSAEDTGLPGESVSVLYGEAMMSMQPDSLKRSVVTEAWRVLKRGGRYGLHELCLVPDNTPADVRRAMEAELANAIRHGVVLMTPSAWRDLLASAGFTVTACFEAPMHLLEPRRMVRDEGLFRSLAIAGRMLLCPEARRRVLRMRSVFRALAPNLRAISLVAEKRY